MNKKKTLILLIVYLISISLFSQQTKSLKGNLLYENYSYAESIEKYEGITDKSIEIKRRLAESYYKTGNYLKSEEYYSQLANDSNRFIDDVYNYAFILSVNKKYENSEKWMKIYNEINSTDSRAMRFINNLGYYDNLLIDNEQFKIKNISYNTEQEDFGTSYYKDKIVFTSSKTDTKFIDRKWNWNKLPYLNLFIADIDSSEFSGIKPFKKSINKKYHEGPASFNEDGTLMVYTQNNYNGKSRDEIIKLQLYFSHYIAGEWQEPSPFLFNSNEYSIGHASLTSDGKTMYLASDMPGGFGGVDLYVSKQNTDLSWSEPINLGEKINTEGNEMFPFIHKDGYLFFASDGLLGLGGLDVFIAKKSSTGFSIPINLGVPINSNFDDFSFIIDKEMKSGYFSSNREEGKGDDDIYSFELLKPFGVEITGTAKDIEGNILAETEIFLYDEKKIIIGMHLTDKSGNYSFTVEPDHKYFLKGKKEKFTEVENLVNTNGITGEIISDLILSSKPDFSFSCLVKDKKTENPIEDVNIILLNKETKKTEKFKTSEDGSFTKILEGKKLKDEVKYNLIITKEGYMLKSIEYQSKLKKDGKQELIVLIDKIEIGMDLNDIIEINPIYFDLNKYNIRPDAEAELDKIVKVMNENPNMLIELGSHTDSRGSDSYNLKLSDKRAKASAKYIKGKIKNPERIYGKGYGESKLKNHCKNGIKCSEELHQENRRTEFKIIKQ